jgi:hypothetical protein
MKIGDAAVCFSSQQKPQQHVFGRRFWQSMNRKSKENRKGTNDFNPRHVQVLLRTYQTGGAAAVLSHTRDPNKGLIIGMRIKNKISKIARSAISEHKDSFPMARR